jgi:cell division transport system permease protein
MIEITIKRIFRSGLQNFFRNGFVSFSSVVVMTITLFIITSMIMLGGLLTYSLDKVKEKVDVNVYFITNADEPEILSIKKTLEGLAEVEEVEYVSREQALARFKEKHKGDDLTLQAIEELGENPLGASLNVRAKDPSQYESIANFLERGDNDILFKNGSTIIDKVNYAQNKVVIERLNSIINSANMAGMWFATIFIIISILITFNTIRLTIFMAKDEISVMRLVGASNKYVKGPFIVSGVLSGLISAFLVIIFFAIITFWVSKYYSAYFVGFNIFGYYTGNFFRIFSILFGSGILLGAFASYLAVQKYLRD